MRRILVICLLAIFPLRAAAGELKAYPEFLRPDPFGQIVKPDRDLASARASQLERRGAVSYKAARGGYASFHLVVEMAQGQDYELDIRFSRGKIPLQAEVYREWFHFMESEKSYYPDALIPVQLPYRSRLPEPDNRIPGQTAQAFWVDIWIPPGAATDIHSGLAVLKAGGKRMTLAVKLEVLAAVIPDEDVVAMDHNSYGVSWLPSEYPRTAARTSDFYSSDDLFRLIHSYHRIFQEHRGIYHQLGYGHAGKVGPEFAPVLEGTGSRKHIANWDAFDRHYGPLLDGSVPPATSTT